MFFGYQRFNLDFALVINGFKQFSPSFWSFFLKFCVGLGHEVYALISCSEQVSYVFFTILLVRLCVPLSELGEEALGFSLVFFKFVADFLLCSELFLIF